ncbi:hypothetical protein [Streptomyces sp. NBC_01236]|uniref:hypothetical protein n=1 Tax=Streptomyces sp. NBC_01236 TaxID=2903789 RepID=UPI003FA3D253
MSQVLWSEPRLICGAGDFTRYDVHVVREYRHCRDGAMAELAAAVEGVLLALGDGVTQVQRRTCFDSSPDRQRGGGL